MIVLFLIVFVGLLGFGIILPLFPFYAERFGASPEVITWTMSGFTLGQAIATPLWGRLSDAIGRRPVLALTMLGGAVSYVILAYADTLWLVILSRVFGGLMGGNVSTAFAYVTDITTDKTRAAGMGKVGAALGLGFIFGPALGGLLAGPEVETANYALPALAAAGISMIALLGTVFFLPESLPVEQRKPLLGPRRAEESQHIGFGRQHRATLLKLLLAALVFYTSMSLMESIFPLWANDGFGLGPRDIGGVFLVLGTVTAVMQGVAIGPLTDRFGEKTVAIAAGVLFALGLSIMAASTAAWQIWFGLVPFGVGVGLFNPSVSSMVSKTAAADERGAIMGQYQAASAMGRVVGPGFSGILYSKIGLAAPFTAGAAIMLPVLLLIGWVTLRKAEEPL